MTRFRWLVLPCLCLLAGAEALRAQTPSARLLADARHQIDDLNWDSAYTLLSQVLSTTTDQAERVRGFTLLGITQLSRSDRVGGRSAFEQALRLDASLKLDSLADLQSDIRVVFAEARSALGISDAPVVVERVQLAVDVTVPADTSVGPTGGALRIETRPSYHSRVVVTVGPADVPSVIVWADTQDVGGIGTRAWNLHGRDGALAAPGRYSLRARAVDSTGQVSPERERILLISRVSVDTTRMPPPLLPSAFAPETVQLRHGAPGGLAAGLAIAAGAVLAPSAMANADIKAGMSSTGAYAVGGAVGVASIVGFLNGHRTQPMPANALANQQLRQRDLAERQRIAQANAQLRESARVRVRLEGAGP